ncbi:coiled-coil domain-containing protein 150 isoform X2 [Pygocentrus nattereri]|uniref:Coiled-coil domain containing 150 n=1 Tax=Pygocentrus nattereri TaxID=42514 RepID=A0AAR2IWD7_PYGNA|nr:coiled-coil domain-containing protein 150 isoform X2 [Pygocentrus nattereri]
MSRPVIRPLSVGATAPESLSLLQQRLLVAEEQTEELLKDMGTLGVSREQLRTPGSPGRGVSMHPLSPVRVQQALGVGGEGTLWRQCEVLVGRVCHLESLLHTLKLTVFRLETERALNPSHTARLQEQLAALQEQSEEEQRSSRREVMRLRDQLEQACQEREEARQEMHKLRQQLDISHSSKMDVAMAADELKIVKVQMSQKLQKMKEEMAEETAARLETEQSHRALLQRVEEMEKVVEREREQVKLLQADSHALRIDGQETRAELQEKEELIESLQKECEQLRDHSDGKETLVSELTSELKSVRTALQKQQQENSRVVRDGEELRAAADKVQVLNDQLEAQCSDLSSALRSLTEENSRLQASLKVEQERLAERLKEQDLMLDAAKRNIRSELQGVLADRLLLKKELDALRADHAKLQQSSAVALETAASHQDLLDRTIERLRGEVSSAVKEREAMQKETDEAKAEVSAVVSKLQRERGSLEMQLSELQVELCEMSSALQKREEENRGLMGRLAAVQHQQSSQQQVEQMLRELMDSKNKLTYEKGKLQTEVRQLGAELKAMGAEHTKQHQRASSGENNYTQVAAVYEALDSAQLDNRSLETALLSKLSTQETLQQHLSALREREAELQEAREEIGHLAEQVDTLRQQLHREKHHRRKSAQRGVAELKKALEDASSRSGDLSRANRELREKVSELENLVSSQRSRIKAQKAQLKQHLDSRVALSSSQRMRELEREIKSLESSKNEYERRCYEQSQAFLQVRSEMADLQAELQILSSSQQGELQAERTLNRTLQEKCKISENLQEAHSWFCSKFDSLNSEVEQNRVEPEEHPESRGNVKDIPAPGQDTGEISSSNGSVLLCVAEPELERWASTLQRWETKKELARIASGHKRIGRRTHSTHSLM